MAYNITDVRSPYLDREHLATLVKAAQRNREFYFDALYRYAWPHVLYLAMGLLKNQLEAEDGAQQAFLYLYEHIGDIREPQAALAYIDRTTCRVGQNMLRSKRRHPASSLDDLYDADTPSHRLNELALGLTVDEMSEDEPDLFPDCPLTEEERNRLIYDLVLELPETLRECVFLRYWGEYHNNEIAEILDVSENVVAVRLKRARKRLGEELTATLRPGDGVGDDGSERDEDGSGEGAAGLSAAVLSIGESLRFMADQKQVVAPFRGYWMKVGADAGGVGAGVGSSVGVGPSAVPPAAGVPSASVLGLGAKGWMALALVAVLVAIGGWFAAMWTTSRPSGEAGVGMLAAAQQASETPVSATETGPASAVATETTAVTVSSGLEESEERPAQRDDPGASRAAETAAPAPFGASDSQVTEVADASPVITLRYSTVYFPVGSAPTLTQVLAVADAHARDSAGASLSLDVHGDLGSEQMNRARSFLVFLHATDSAGRQATVKVLQITITR